MNDILISNWWISSQLIINEANNLGLNTKIISEDNNLFYVEKNWKKIYFKSVDCWLNTSFWLKVVDNKELTYLISEENWIRVPKSIYISRKSLNKIDLNVLNIDFPLITKPTNWAHWDWVSINLKNYEELKKWLKYSFKDKKVSKVIIQEQIIWEDHRILILNWKVEAVTKRIAPYIIWNWENTISELIKKENKNPLRGNWWNHDSPLSKIKIDSELKNFISEQWYNMKDILENKKQINVRKNVNLSTWWLAINVTNKINPEIKNEVEKISKIIWLWLCWVDFFCEDITLWLKEGNWAIIEINATPWIRMHHFPSIWEPINIAKKILEAVF